MSDCVLECFNMNAKPHYSEPITFHVTKDQKKAILVESWDTDLTVSQIIRRALTKTVPALNGNGKGHDGTNDD